MAQFVDTRRGLCNPRLILIFPRINGPIVSCDGASRWQKPDTFASLACQSYPLFSSNFREIRTAQLQNYHSRKPPILNINTDSVHRSNKQKFYEFLGYATWLAPLCNEKHLLFGNDWAHLAEKPVGQQWTSVRFIVSSKTWNCSKQNTESESSRREVLLVCK